MVVLPSPAFVGVIAVTPISFPFGRSARRSSDRQVDLRLVPPVELDLVVLQADLRRRARRSDAGSPAWAISRLEGILVVAICAPQAYPREDGGWVVSASGSTSAARSPTSSRSWTESSSPRRCRRSRRARRCGIAAALRAAGIERGGRRARARDDGGDERAARAARRADGARHDRGVPRRDRDRPAEPRVALRPDRARAGAARPARAAVRRARADGARGRARAARRGLARGRGRRPCAAAEVEAVAVCLLFSFLHPEHERRVGEALRAALPGVRVSLSTELLPEFREYERCSTTVANAYLAPALSAYLAEIEPRPLVMQSSGGVVDAAAAAARPAACVLSGPAAGVVGAAFVAAPAASRDVLTFDMGGTSTDVAAVLGGERAGDGRVGRRRACRSGSRWSTCTRSARAAARSPGWTTAARCASGRARRAPRRGRRATAAAARSRP